MASTTSKLRLAGAVAALATLALAISCRGFFVNPTLSSLAIGPQNLNLAPDQSFQMVATGTFSDGSTADVSGKASWNSSNTAVATFASSGGRITATSLQNLPNPPGTTTVTASYQAVTSSSVTVTVCPVVQTLVMTINGGSSSVTVAGNTTLTFKAEATFNGVTGTTDVTGNVTWNISNTNVLPSITNGSGTTQQGFAGQSAGVSATLCGVTSNNLTVTTTS
jgi:hypothetical protein